MSIVKISDMFDLKGICKRCRNRIDGANRCYGHIHCSPSLEVSPTVIRKLTEQNFFTEDYYKFCVGSEINFSEILNVGVEI